MSLELWIRLIAGSFVIISVALSYLHSAYWLFFTLFVGVNLFQSAYPLVPDGGHAQETGRPQRAGGRAPSAMRAIRES